jgi:hypothetical protein
MGVGDTGKPVTGFALSEQLLPIGGTPIVSPAVEIGAPVAGIVQGAERRRYGERLENYRLLVAYPGRKVKPSLRNTLTVWQAEPTREKGQSCAKCQSMKSS